MFKSILSVAISVIAVSIASATPFSGPGIRLCSVGYLPEIAKVATVVGANDSDRFSIVDEVSGKVVYTGELGSSVDSYQTGESARLADFSELDTSGTYRMKIEGLPDSAAFAIDPNALNRSLACAMIGFYGQRCGQAVHFEWNGDTFAYDACHLEDGLLDYLDPSKVGETKDGTGGWHDAGDYGKYTVNAAFATGIMLAAWERRSEALEAFELPAIPEHNGDLPDYLAEVKYNMDWILKMQIENGEASHKLTTLNFGGMVLPNEIDAPRYFTATSRLATIDLAAVSCMAARVFRPYDPAYADQCEEAAKKAWIAARDMTNENPDTSAFTTGGYLTETESDYKWALVEIRLTFGKDFLSEFEQSMFEWAVNNDNQMFSVAWDWGRAFNLGLYSWLFSEEAKKNPQALEALQADLIASADVGIRNAKQHAYGRGIKGYGWGTNGVVARNVMNLHAAYLVSQDSKYLDTAYEQIAYLYGRNPYNRSFVTGDGIKPPAHPHHRPSEGDKVEAPWPGHLVGGANPTEADWFDEMSSYRTNETAINWDAALVYALAVFYQPEK